MNPDKPNPYVYDLALPEAAIRDYFSQNVDLIHELCCYGSNLLLRCHTQKGNKLEDVILIGCLFRQFLVHLDAIYTLLSKGAVERTTANGTDYGLFGLSHVSRPISIWRSRFLHAKILGGMERSVPAHS